MIEDIILDALTDGPMDAYALMDEIKAYDVTEDEAIAVLNEMYDNSRIRAWNDGQNCTVGLP